jgi:hypothetical protein
MQHPQPRGGYQEFTPEVMQSCSIQGVAVTARICSSTNLLLTIHMANKFVVNLTNKAKDNGGQANKTHN